MGKERGDTEQWVFPQVVLSKEEKKKIVAEVMGIIAEVLFDNHLLP